MKKLQPAFNLVIPTILFWMIYQLLGILPAIFVSVLFGVASIIRSFIKKETVSNTQILGLLGLLLSGISITLSGNEKLYYVPALASNFILLGLMIVLTWKKKSVFLYLAKDFHVPSLEAISEKEILALNYLWMLFFFLKCMSKIIGLLYLDFDKLYWIVFLLGDPATICVVALSVIYITRKLSDIK